MMHPKLPMNARIPHPPLKSRPMYAPRARNPSVRATKLITCPNTARARSRVTAVESAGPTPKWAAIC
jgi:hypothetical protein